MVVISEIQSILSIVGEMMSNHNDLYEKLFDASPKKSPEDNLFQFNLQLNPINPSDKQKKHKKKKEEDVHQYIRLAEKSNEKVSTSAKKWKEEQTMTPQQIRQKKQLAKIHSKFKETKKAAQPESTSKKKYMPNIIDPFGKPEKKGDKAPSVSTTIPKKEAQKLMRNEQEKNPAKISKVEAKQNKIREKQRQKEKEKVKEKVVIKQERQDKPQQRREEKRQEKKDVKRQSKPSKKKVSSSSSGSDSESESEQDWRKQLRQITKYNPSDRKFKIRDLQEIKESGVDRIFGEDKVSYRMGVMQQEQDLRRQMQMKQKKHKHKHKHRHH